jgi:hypothetical protein
MILPELVSTQHLRNLIRGYLDRLFDDIYVVPVPTWLVATGQLAGLKVEAVVHIGAV